MWNNIPQELKDYPQWCCAGQHDRAPIDPKTGNLASVDNPASWGTFEQAINAGYPHIGFMLWSSDPYCVIDLDNKVTNPATAEELQRYQSMMETFGSYTESSASGRGLHIVVKARLEQGRRRDKIEVYSSHRFMVFTGNVVKAEGIQDRQELVDNLISQMEPVAVGADLLEYDELLADREIIEMAMRAANADKFNRLCAGEWESDYGSQSEADFALMAMFAFYSRSNEQCRRLFRMSALGQREKAQKNDKYLDYALSKIRAKEAPPVDLAEIQSRAEKVTKATRTKQGKTTQADIAVPEGLVGELALYIFNSSSRPVWEISLCAALALTAGITGRHYNISGTGLNQYIILIAKTGTGKEEAIKGIDRLLAQARSKVPPIDGFLGPAAFASGQGLIRTLDEQPCMVCVLGEFGIMLQGLNDPRANAAQVTLRRALLDLYSKSGWGSMLRSSAYSDKEKNTKTIMSPALTLLGESTPEEFYGGLDETQIASGLIPRFLLVEYQGDRPRRNNQSNQAPDPILVQKLADLATTILHMQTNSTHADVTLSQGAGNIMDAFDRRCDDHINAAGNGAEAQLWNRAHLKALKLAGLVAVGCNMHDPVVSEETAQWAVDMVVKDVSRVMERFHSGEVGEGEIKQESDIRRIVEEYLNKPAAQRAHYKVPKSLLEEPVVPRTYLRRRLRNLGSFRNDRRGVAMAIRMAIEDACEGGVIAKVPEQDAKEKWGLHPNTATIYSVGDQW